MMVSSALIDELIVTVWPLRIVIVFALTSGTSVAGVQFVTPSCDDCQVATAFQGPVAADLKKSLAADVSVITIEELVI